MSDPIVIALIGAAASTIAAIAAVVQARQTHNLVNSRMTELLALARSESAVTATLAERDAETLRSAAKITALNPGGGKSP